MDRRGVRRTRFGHGMLLTHCAYCCRADELILLCIVSNCKCKQIRPLTSALAYNVINVFVAKWQIGENEISIPSSRSPIVQYLLRFERKKLRKNSFRFHTEAPRKVNLRNSIESPFVWMLRNQMATKEAARQHTIFSSSAICTGAGVTPHSAYTHGQTNTATINWTPHNNTFSLPHSPVVHYGETKMLQLKAKNNKLIVLPVDGRQRQQWRCVYRCHCLNNYCALLFTFHKLCR